MTTLHDRLVDLADAVGAQHPAREADLWDLGRRQHRRRQAAASLASAAAVAFVLGLVAVLGLPSSTDRTAPADVPFDELHLPRTVYAPSPWAPGTDEAGPIGALAAVGTGTRTRPEGLSGQRDRPEAFGVSAVDGSVRWLDLPHTAQLGFGTLALSPDGSKVGYGLLAEDGTIGGWAVYDTSSGTTVQLHDPATPVLAGVPTFPIEFSGDSRYLQTDYSRDGSDGLRDDSFVIWDVETGEPTVVEGPGHYWLPNLGSAPTGIVWSRKADTFTFDPRTGETTTRTAGTDRLVEWSDGPGGLSVYIDRGERNKDPWRLFSGEGVELSHDLDVDDILGWRDGRTVVVQDTPTHRVRFIDVTSGRTVGTEELRVAEDGNGSIPMAPVYAGDLWANAIVEGERPPDLEDPRVTVSDVLRIVGPASALGVVSWVLWRRRVRP